jgi:carbamoyl-phosphate synthase large subunit
LRAIEICCDKRETSRFLKTSGFLTPQTLSLEDARRHGFPLFIKPWGGSASIDAHRIDNPDELEFFARHVEESMIQEFIEGKEITTDVFSDWSGEPLVAVPRRRLWVRAGEVSVGRVERNPELESICMSVAKLLATIGPVNIQAIQTREAIYITEINPRFGGGCMLSVAAGAPFAEWTIQMALRHALGGNPPEVRDGITLMRFDDSFYCPADRIAK